MLHTMFLKCAGKDNFQELIILIPKKAVCPKKVGHFQEAICFVKNDSFHGITKSYKF